MRQLWQTFTARDSLVGFVAKYIIAAIFADIALCNLRITTRFISEKHQKTVWVDGVTSHHVLTVRVIVSFISFSTHYQHIQFQTKFDHLAQKTGWSNLY